MGKPLDAIFQSVEPSPIACASIAQVHKARLLNGKEVVIKIQHAKVAYRLLQDLKNLETIGNVVRSLDPDFDFSPVIREWAREIPKELDFRCEARSMQRVERNLAHLAPAQLAACNSGGCDDAASLSIEVSFPQVNFKISPRERCVLGFPACNRTFIRARNRNRTRSATDLSNRPAQQSICSSLAAAALRSGCPSRAPTTHPPPLPPSSLPFPRRWWKGW